MQREARFILPAQFNDGRALPQELVMGTIDKLIGEFGGATLANAFGYWKRPEDGKVVSEHVLTFDVALPEDQAKIHAFVAIATHAAIEAKQHSVYIRLPSGEVTIPTVQPLLEAVA